MARNGSGSFSVVNTFVEETTISPDEVNQNFTDIGDEITNSLALDGQSSMTGQVKAAAGAAATPGYSWANETNSGWYRAGAGDFRYAIGGTDVVKITSGGLTLVSGAFSGLGANAVTTTNITDANVTTAKLADGAVTTAKLADANVTAAKLSTGAPSWDSSGNVTATGSVTDSKGNLRALPANAKSSGYTLVASDGGKVVPNTTGGWTVNNSVFAAGDAVTLYNDSDSTQTITQGTGVTLRKAGSTTTGNLTLNGRGFATIWFKSASEAIAAGNLA